MTYQNDFVRLVKRPDGAPTSDIFELASEDVRAPAEGEFLVRNIYLSMDPALVQRLRDEDNYTDKIEPGEVMHAYAIGQVVASRCETALVGEVRLGRFDMQTYALSDDPAGSRVIDATLVPPTWYLGVIGTTGATASLALSEILGPVSGETMVISAGASSVGWIAAQLAKRIGCRTVGIVSTDEKAAKLSEDAAYDAVVSYRGKSVDELAADLAAVCPSGVDTYFDNTSGDISSAVIDLYNDNARIAVIGRLALSHLKHSHDDIGRRDSNAILSKRIRKQGMVLFDYQDRLGAVGIELAGLVLSGELRFKEDILEGIGNAPVAFFRMLDGKNDGKQLVKLADIEPAQAAE
jgi:NADPH-dependent curcumin reductase CurA